MPEESKHVERLRRIREDRATERRLVAMSYGHAADNNRLVEGLVSIQLQIEALDRAIADEEVLARQRLP